MRAMNRALASAFLAVLLALVFISSANAACGYLNKLRPSAFTWRENFGGREYDRALLVLVSDEPGIVGLWRVTFLSEKNPGIPDNTVIDAGFAEWHSDGTEIMNSSRVPATGNFCLGVWTRSGPRSYKLNHFALNFKADGTLVGPTRLYEEVALNGHDSFVGSFTIDDYDQNGNLLDHIGGRVEGKRITVDTSVADVL
jgi:hypothetical protein